MAKLWVQYESILEGEQMSMLVLLYHTNIEYYKQIEQQSIMSSDWLAINNDFSLLEISSILIVNQHQVNRILD